MNKIPLRPTSLADIETILQKIERGTFNRRDTKLLLLEVREYTDEKSILRDIGNCIHPFRERGQAWREIKKRFELMADTAINLVNDGIYEVDFLFRTDEIITEFVKVIHAIGFEDWEKAIHTNSNQIMRFICEFLDGTYINFENQHFRRCKLKLEKRVNDDYSMTFGFEPIGIFSNAFKDNYVQFPFFDKVLPQ